jgi:hypothetical protein
MKKLIMAAVVTSVLLSGCAVNKNWGARGGSKADGIVKLAYSVGLFEQVKLTVGQGLQVAQKRCEAWGYTGAEPFDFLDRQCVSTSNGSCNMWTITQEYQCL